MTFKLRIWRQPDAKTPGKLVDYDVRDISPSTSFLEMLDILNETLVKDGKEPIAFDRIAAKVFAALARLRLTASHTVPIILARCVSFT